MEPRRYFLDLEELAKKAPDEPEPEPEPEEPKKEEEEEEEGPIPF